VCFISTKSNVSFILMMIQSPHKYLQRDAPYFAAQDSRLFSFLWLHLGCGRRHLFQMVAWSSGLSFLRDYSLLLNTMPSIVIGIRQLQLEICRKPLVVGEAGMEVLEKLVGMNARSRGVSVFFC
jgi:hypothetical protein